MVAAINARGYGLTCGLHSRIDDRVERVTARLHVGNAYVNRNQIGAIVGSQPFGGEGLSGTGPKAGGPFYLPRLQAPAACRRRAARGAVLAAEAIGAAFAVLDAGDWATREDRRAVLAARLKVRAVAPPRRSRRPRCSTASRATCRGRPARATA